MHRRSILRSIPCDLEKLPIGALEAFILSQVHERSAAEEVAEATGLELSDLARVVRRLAELGALSVDEAKAPLDGPISVRATSRPPGGRSLVPAAVVPVAREHSDVRSLGIGPREGFVLSQIDGATSTADLGEITSLSARELSTALRALEAAGVVDLGHARRRSSKTLRAAVPAGPGKEDLGPVRRRSSKAMRAGAPAAPHKEDRGPPTRRSSKAIRAVAVTTPTAPPDSGACDLTEAERTRITETSARLEAVDLYTTLGIGRNADVKAIRRAYHALAAQFHPDRFFGRRLGAFRRPLERVFMRLTFAYETLSNKDKRATYDATLPAQTEKRASRRPPQSKRPSRKSQRAMRRPSSARHSATAAPRDTGAALALASEPAPERASGPVPARVSGPAPARASGRVPARVSGLAPAPSLVPPSAPAPSRPDPFRRMYATKQRRTIQEHVDVFVRAAREALDRDDVVSAANHYRLAVQCSDDPALRAALDEVDGRARKRVCESSLAGAREAEQAGRWGEAAAKYARAHGARAEAWIAERAANALRLEGRDLRRAAQLAEQAVLAEPHNVGYRVTLGEVYLDAGLFVRAAGEAGRALAIAPDDVRVTAFSKRVAKVKLPT